MGTVAPYWARHAASRPTGSMLERGVRAAMQEWVQHHQGCATCSKQDWFNPGSPAIVPKANGRLGTRTLKLPAINGTPAREVYFVMAPDLSTLCRKGRLLYKGWERAIIQYVRRDGAA